MIDSVYRFLSGLGFSDPLHPPIVHVPIGLVIGALVALAVAILFKRDKLVITARHLSILALIFVFPSILFGVFDWIHFFHGALLPAIKIKMFLAGGLLVLLGIGIVIGGEEKPHLVSMSVIYVLSFVSVVALGWFGAGLLYGRGAPVAEKVTIGVARGAAPLPAPLPRLKTTGAAPDGAALFAVNCQSCHPSGGNIIEAKLPIKGSARLAELKTFQAFIRAPTMPDGKTGAMPAFSDDELESAQVQALYLYLEANYK
jgi:mono/diheme cytochrome c family protein